MNHAEAGSVRGVSKMLASHICIEGTEPFAAVSMTFARSEQVSFECIPLRTMAQHSTPLVGSDDPHRRSVPT